MYAMFILITACSIAEDNLILRMSFDEGFFREFSEQTSYMSSRSQPNGRRWGISISIKKFSSHWGPTPENMVDVVDQSAISSPFFERSAVATPHLFMELILAATKLSSTFKKRLSKTKWLRWLKKWQKSFDTSNLTTRHGWRRIQRNMFNKNHGLSYPCNDNDNNKHSI